MKDIKVTIKEPCHVNLDAMPKTECGRMCTVCTIDVQDFSKMSTKELQEALQTSTAKCGQFHSRHTDPHKIGYKFLNGMESFFSKLKMTRVAMVLISASMFLSSCYRTAGVATYVKNDDKDGAKEEQKDDKKPQSCRHIKRGKYVVPNN